MKFLSKHWFTIYLTGVVIFEVLGSSGSAYAATAGVFSSGVFGGGLSNATGMVQGVAKTAGPLAFTAGVISWGVGHITGKQGAHKYGIGAMAGGALIAAGGYVGPQMYSAIAAKLGFGG